MTRNFLIIAVMLGAFCWTEKAPAAEVDYSFLTSIGYTGLDRESGINTNFRGDDPFNPIRVMVFVESWVNPRLGVFLEFLWDQGKTPNGRSTKPRINGAYAMARPWDTDALMFKIGMIPALFGSWAPRTYVDVNPLVGLPLTYHYRTPIKSKSLPLDVADLRSWKDSRGLPIVYDACWDHGIIAFGFAGRWDYSIGITKASLSSPSAYGNGGAQVLGRLGLKPVVGLALGLSFEYGSYLKKDAENLPPAEKNHGPNQKALGLDFSYSYAYTSVHAELVRNWWESPNLGTDLGVTSGYVEIQQKLSPGLYLAARFDRLSYDTLQDPIGGSFSWGNAISRVEVGGGYYFSKGVLLKAVLQHNEIEDKESVDLLSAQLVLTF